MQDIQPIVYTKVQKPLGLIYECYHGNTCLFVTCDNVIQDNVTCEVWPGLTGYTGDYFSDETSALVDRSSSWTYNTTCQYWSYRGFFLTFYGLILWKHLSILELQRFFYVLRIDFMETVYIITVVIISEHSAITVMSAVHLNSRTAGCSLKHLNRNS